MSDRANREAIPPESPGFIPGAELDPARVPGHRGPPGEPAAIDGDARQAIAERRTASSEDGGAEGWTRGGGASAGGGGGGVNGDATEASRERSRDGRKSVVRSGERADDEDRGRLASDEEPADARIAGPVARAALREAASPENDAVNPGD